MKETVKKIMNEDSSAITDIKLAIIEKLDVKYGIKKVDEAKDSFIGKVDKFNWAMKISGIPANYPTLPFGHQIDHRKKFKSFKDSAKSTHIDAKGKATLPAVKKWITENKPSEYYAKWQVDSKSYKDDVIEIFYK